MGHRVPSCVPVTCSINREGFCTASTPLPSTPASLRVYEKGRPERAEKPPLPWVFGASQTDTYRGEPHGTAHTI
eukprot:2853004-Prymnesium_polylepis.1